LITIPTRTGSRIRRRSGGVSLASTDVPPVTPARDPGVDATEAAFIDAKEVSSAAGLGTVGTGLQTLAQGLSAEADLSLQTLRREEGLARDSDDTTFSQLLNEKLRELQAAGDLSDRERSIDPVVDFMQKERDRILKEHRGGNTSRTQLQNRLDRRFIGFTDTLAALNINAADKRQQRTINQRVSAITQDVLDDPDVLSSEDPLEAFRTHSGQLEDEIEFLGLRPEQAAVIRNTGKSQILSSMITALLKNGQTERVKEILRSDELEGVASPETLRDFFQRVIDFERKKSALDDESPEVMAARDVTEARVKANLLGLRGEDAEDFVMAEVSKGTAKQQAIGKLQRRGVIDENLAAKMLADVIKVIPLRDEFGNPQGTIIVDLSESEITAPGISSSTIEAQPGELVESTTPTSTTPTSAAPEPTASEPTTEEQVPTKRSLFDIVTGDLAVTGVGPAVLETLQGVFGQLGVSIAEPEQLLYRKDLSNARRNLSFALVPNDRFPQNQVDFILDTTDIDPEILKDRRTLLASLVSLDRSLATTQAQAEQDSASNSGLPQETRRIQSANARAIRNFRDTLDVPPGITPEQIKALGEPSKGGIKAVTDLVAETLKGAASAVGVGSQDIQVPRNKDDIDNMTIDRLRIFVLGASDEVLDTLPEEIKVEILKKLRSGSKASGIK